MRLETELKIWYSTIVISVFYAISCYIELQHMSWKDVYAYIINAYNCQILTDNNFIYIVPSISS